MKKTIYINASFLTLPMVGITRVAIEVCRELLKTNEKIIFISPSKIAHEQIGHEFSVKKIGFLDGFLWEQIELPLYLINKDVHLLLNFTNTAPIFFKKNVTAILDIIPLLKPEWTSKKLYYLSKFLTPIIAKRSLKIFTLSEYSKKDIIENLKVDPKKVEVIYCGIKPLIVDIRQNSLVEKINSKYILAVSSLEPRKNFENIVHAFNLLEKYDLTLVLVGPNFQYHINKLLPFINKERTIIRGYVSDEELEVLYKNAVAFVYPSLYEGFGLPPLEAMQYGCPVITSNLTSIPEICGDAVLYCNPYSPEDIANNIKILLDNNKVRNILIEKGRVKAKEFTWERTADLLLKAINNIN